MFDLIPWKRRKNESNEVVVRDSTTSPFDRLHSEFNSLAKRMFNDWSSLTGGIFDPNWGWETELEDRDNEYSLRVEAPGFELDDFNVQVIGNQLVIRAERNQESKSAGGTLASHKQLHRRITLPSGGDLDQLKASYKNGVLEIQLPKTQSAQPKKITVKAE